MFLENVGGKTSPECRGSWWAKASKRGAGFDVIYLTQFNSLFVSVLKSNFVILGWSWLQRFDQSGPETLC